MTFNAPGLCCFWLLFLALACGVEARQSAPPPSIEVTGQAEVRVPPDEVIFTLEVEKMDKDLPTAQRMTDDSVRQLLVIARRFDTPPQDVKTDYISVEMKYSTDLVEDSDDADAKKVKREFVGYAVSKTVVLRSARIEQFEALFTDLLRAGVSSVKDVEFRTTQIRMYKDQARAQAIRAAKEKAEAMTREIGQTIGKAISIEEEGGRGNPASNNFSAVISGSYNADESAAFAPGLITIRATVAVKFALN